MINQAKTNSLLYPERAFGGFSNRDGSVRFYMRVNALLKKEDILLDYGCGEGFHKELAPAGFSKDLQIMKGKVQKVIGVDTDSGARGNPHIDEFLPVESGSIPLPDDSVDVCLSEWVVEHLSNVERFLAECHRVLKPGGILCVRTPNLFHYTCLGAALIPFKYHTHLRHMLGHPHSEKDVFPTLYRCNTLGKAKRMLSSLGFVSVAYRHRGESHLMNCGLRLAWIGKMIEEYSPSLLWHELHLFGRKEAPGVQIEDAS